MSEVECAPVWHTHYFCVGEGLSNWGDTLEDLGFQPPFYTSFVASTGDPFLNQLPHENFLNGNFLIPSSPACISWHSPIKKFLSLYSSCFHYEFSFVNSNCCNLIACSF